ncbi:hypothetical protein CBM2633_B11210 [Cupriavidus taiwanensis]|nr:hypothetical protein CBM2633_B11210 [Cupriavidus taiwanensis]
MYDFLGKRAAAAAQRGGSGTRGRRERLGVRHGSYVRIQGDGGDTGGLSRT